MDEKSAKQRREEELEAKAAQRKFDDFQTDLWVVQAILPYLPIYGVRRVVEPCAGLGNILNAVEKRWNGAELAGYEIQEKYIGKHPRVRHVDGLDPGLSWGKPDLIITNPPYKKAMEFVIRAFEEIMPGGTIAFLLRLGWLCSLGRSDFHLAQPADIYALAKRPSFTGGGTDMTEYAWFVWGPGRGGRWFILNNRPPKVGASSKVET